MERILLNMALEKYKRFFRKSYQKSLHNHFFYVKITNCIWIRLWLETHTPFMINEQHVNHEGSFLMLESKLENFVFTVMMAFVTVYAMICYNIALTIGGDEGCCLTGRLPRNDDHVAGCNHPGDVRLWKACRLLDSAADYTWNANLADHLDPVLNHRLPALCAQQWAWSQPRSSRTFKQLASSGPGCRLPSSTFQWRLAGKSSSAVLR